ncbi:LmeA family phospholipid-binding protein [Streptomyces griseoluteus]|uniref:LmeA family phospholipid-binding protein n=1 Tax=Streptomyces griseoluteus TaxID=29306 RepID=UPI003669FB78
MRSSPRVASHRSTNDQDHAVPDGPSSGRTGPEGEGGGQPSGRRGRGRKRTRRLRNLRRLGKAGVAIAVALAFLVLGDRFALLFAERETEGQLQKSLRLEAAPQVEIDGFPFLTQVLDKRIDTAHVTVPDLAADRVSLARVHATVHGVRLDGELPSHLRGGTIRSVDGDVLLSFEDLDRELGASQVRFSKLGPGSIKAEGQVPIGGQRLRLHAEARIGRSGDRGVSTDISRMRLDIGDVAVFRPGRNGGLRLTPKAARAVARQRDKVRAMLAVPVIAERAGIDRSQIRAAMRSESALDRLTGTPGFVGELMKVNLFDVVADQPDLPAKLGVDPGLMGAVRGVTEPQLADRLDLSFELPRTPGDIRIQRITVERDGIRARLGGGALPFGDTSGARAAGGR